MTKVFILTEDGNSYSTNGLKVIKNDLKELFDETNELVFEQGKAINDKKLLIDLLTRNPESYIALSTATSIDYLPSQCFEDVKNTLKEKNNKTSWKALCDRLDEQRKRKNK